MSGPVITVPTKIGIDAVEFVYTAKLWGIPISRFSKSTIIWVPAGTKIDVVLKDRFWATRSMITGDGAGVGIDVPVEEGVPVRVDISVGAEVSEGIGVGVI